MQKQETIPSPCGRVWSPVIQIWFSAKCFVSVSLSYCRSILNWGKARSPTWRWSCSTHRAFLLTVPAWDSSHAASVQYSCRWLFDSFWRPPRLLDILSIQKKMKRWHPSVVDDAHAVVSVRIKREFADTDQRPLLCFQTQALHRDSGCTCRLLPRLRESVFAVRPAHRCI